MEKGADPLIKDPSGQIALDRAEQGGHEKVSDYLLSFSKVSSRPRQDFVDRPGLHFNPMPVEQFLKRQLEGSLSCLKNDFLQRSFLYSRHLSADASMVARQGNHPISGVGSF